MSDKIFMTDKEASPVALDVQKIGINIFQLIEKLFPICRSITGAGVKQTFEIIREVVPIETHSVSSGTPVYDWVIPKEWNVRDAYIKNSEGKKILDFKTSNIHLVGYSDFVHKMVPLDELKTHLFTLPDYPDWIPYLTTYYKRDWGFCLSHNDYAKLKDGLYEVFIDAELKDGSLTYGELYIPGKQKDEILFSSYICHPSMCNDNLTGPALLTYLAKSLLPFNLKYSYRFILIPETIGAIAWLALNEEKLSNIKYGMVATCCGDSGSLTYKRTRSGNSLIDKIVERVLEESAENFKVVDFFPMGSDERQFSSPGFNLQIGSLMRTMYGKFPEYHTSADNLDFISAGNLADSFEKYFEIVYILENNDVFENLNPKCEPQLGKRGLYRTLGGQKKIKDIDNAFFWVLNFSDGIHSLLDISLKSGIRFKTVRQAADILLNHGLLKMKTNKEV